MSQSELERVSVSGAPEQKPEPVATATPSVQPPNSPIYGVVNPGPQPKICMLIPTGVTVDVRWGFMFPQLLADLPPGFKLFC